ncbi:response regulator transcription factor [Lacinutrix sp. Bg11-31]|uniref:response regulator transcription factor n=1 Tax=Lacinutrix sp. Bg11-31 TaxID=2057808 RepID=UPI000C30966A|nr:response regulator transcription factor [Lacinutrix sp. Bg11-31]AUC82196.1 DNA-binding response regulator [Lacinutrix sp. Bg11-31]
MIRLAIAEDHQSLIDGLELLLKYEEGISIVGTANDGEQLLEIVRLKQPNVVITDIRMPKMDGITAAKQIIKEFPTTKILAFSMFDQLDAIEQMLEAGAKGYILKNSSLNEVLLAIRTIHKGEKYFDKNIDTNALGKEKNNSKKGLLTKRQIEILHLVAQGKTSREIAEQLFIGIHTVDTHRKNMIRILGLKGKGELMRYALEKKYTFKNTRN